MRWLWLTALLVVCASTADAQAVWRKFGQPADQSTQTLASGAVVYDFTATDSTGFSPIVQNWDCDYVTLQFDPDLAGTSGSATVQLYSCLNNATPTTNHCGKVLTDLDGDGVPNDTALTGVDGTGSVAQLRYIYEVRGLPLLAVNRVAAATGNETPRVLLTCGSAQ